MHLFYYVMYLFINSKVLEYFPDFRLINMFSWSGLIDTNILLSEAFQVPNLKTGKMEPLITSLTQREEEQFANMLKRLNTVFQVPIKTRDDKYI